MSLKSRFSLHLAVFGSGILLVAAVSFYYLGRNETLREQQERSVSTLQRVAEVCGEALLNQDYIPALNYLKIVGKEPGVKTASCLDSSGRIQADTNSKMIGEVVAQAPVEKGSPGGLSRETFTMYEVTILRLRKPVEAGGRPVGFAIVGLDLGFLSREISDKLQGLILRILALAAALALPAIIAVSIALAETLTRPIREMEKAAAEFGAGRFERQLAAAGMKDELGSLARSLSDMARKLGELDRLKQRFFESITHDLRSPLTAIEGYAEMLLGGMHGPLAPKQMEDLRIMHSNSKRVEEYVNDILDLAKLQAGSMTIEKGAVPVPELVRSVEEMSRASAQEYGIRLEAEVEPGLPPVSGDEKLLHRTLANLATNALKFTPAQGRIVIGARRAEDGFVALWVSDTGPGIPKDKLESVFEKFSQVAETKGMARKAGTGLGLTIAREIVLGHGGRIWAESEPGKGARIAFTIPIA